MTTADEKLPPPGLNEKSEVSNSTVADPVREDSTNHSIVTDPISADSATNSQLQTVVTHATPDRGSSEEDGQYGPALPPPSSGPFSVGIPPSETQSPHPSTSVNSYVKHSSPHRKHKKHHRTSDSRRHQEKHKSHHRKKEKRKKVSG